MQSFRHLLYLLCVTVTLLLGSGSVLVIAQEKPEPIKLEIEPESLTLQVGETANLAGVVRDSEGRRLDAEVLFFSRDLRGVGVTRTGHVEAHRAGRYTVVALVVEPGEPLFPPRLSTEIPVIVAAPALESVEFVDSPTVFYADTIQQLRVLVVDRSGAARDDVEVTYRSDQPQVASIDPRGQLTVHRSGRVEISATAGSLQGLLDATTVANPVTAFDLVVIDNPDPVRTGDVVQLRTLATDGQGREVLGLPVQFAVYHDVEASDSGFGASAQITADGRFVAERPGLYTVSAMAGRHSALRSLEVLPRNVDRRLELVGRGVVRDKHTSDLWVWEASDGRDYAILGTWGADGTASIWDVTDPSAMTIVDTIEVDARTVNDVKVSPDGRVAVISREGASDRRNGLVILDVSEPHRGVQILSQFDDQLSGGVHNVFVDNQHVYALSAGRRYDIINIEDPRNPHRVGRFELDTPGHAVHDVWVKDGIAYSSNWQDGIVVVDVGGGGRGGSPQNPVMLGSYTYPSDWNHAAFPYRSKSTGKFYVFAGDEAFPSGFHTAKRGVPTQAAGWIHVIEWDDWSNPREVARYQVPEAGSHNLWIENDIMYVGYYNAGLRIVDVSGELIGDLYRQGREIARFIPADPQGYIANAPFTWGIQPYKGNIFFADWNSGLWAARLAAAGDGND